MPDELLNIPNYFLSSIHRSANSMTITLGDQLGNHIQIELQNLVHYLNHIKDRPLCRLRVDSGGTVYGLDFSMRLKCPEIKDYEVLYLFWEGDAGPVFSALAEKVVIN
ncbi:MAG: hypothetical protein WCF67_12170 [Chitinophagaceae bacterium]